MATKAADNLDGLVTRGDVETIVERSLGPEVNVLDYHLESYSSKNKDLMGACRNLIVEVSRDGTEETHAYFLKTIANNIKNQAKFLEDSGMFRKETGFYNLILPELIRSSADGSWVPKCYLEKKNTLVLENLKLKNYVLRDRFLDVSSLKSALTSLAKMHAASILAEKRLGKTFIEMYPNLMQEEVLFTLEGSFAEWYRSGIIVATKVAEKLGLNHKIVPLACNSIREKIRPSKIRRNVVCHGDAYSYNFMFKDDECALVDFQLMRYVPPMVDVAQAIYFNMRREVREKYEKELLECYYETFSKVLKSGGMDAPSFEDISDEYEEMRIVGIVTVNLYFPANFLVERKAKEPESFADLFSRDRLNLVLEAMEEEESYRELITSIVTELVEVAETVFK